MEEKLLIGSKSDSPRLRYICDLMLGDLAGLSCIYTTDMEKLASWKGPALFYGDEPSPGSLFLRSTGLLFEHHLNSLPPGVAAFQQQPVLCYHGREDSILPYDPLSAGFYMVSRYEEYDMVRTDRYGRFPATGSIAFRNGFLESPVVHWWADHLARAIADRFPALIPRKPGYRFLSTIDIDHAYAYLHRPLYRTTGGIARSLLHGDFGGIFRRANVLLHLSRDPYDVYEEIFRMHEKLREQPLFFILYASYGGKDNNIPVNRKAFTSLLQQLSQHGEVGVHPSLASGKHPKLLESEVRGLGRALKRKITSSRQHHLKLVLPRTYRNLIKAGITQDYTMGYASHPGFRAGIAHPFRFFDLVRNDVTPLVLTPVILMDVTLRDYLRLTEDQSIAKASALIRQVKNAGGTMVTLWHNESLSEQGRWKGWRSVYEKILLEAEG